MIRSRAAVLLLLALMGSTGAERDPLAGRVAGKPQNCISLNRAVSPEIVDRNTILYHETNRRIWRTGPVDACPSLRPLDILIVDVYGAQLCRNDRFRTVQPGQSIPSGYCRFDRFTPYDLPRGRTD